MGVQKARATPRLVSFRGLIQNSDEHPRPFHMRVPLGSEQRVADEWFHCEVFNFLWRQFMIFKSIDNRKIGIGFIFC